MVHILGFNIKITIKIDIKNDIKNNNINKYNGTFKRTANSI